MSKTRTEAVRTSTCTAGSTRRCLKDRSTLSDPPPPGRRAALVAVTRLRGGLAPAVVLGDMDLVRPLVLADIPVAVVTPPGDSARRSRYTTAIADWDPTGPNDGLVDALLAWGRLQGKRPLLFYQSDDHVRFVARHEDRLRRGVRLPARPAGLRMVRKDMFAELAATVG